MFASILEGSSIDFIVQNYGEQVGIYFAFLSYLIQNLSFLVVIGIVTYALDEIFDEDVNTSPFETIYAMVTILWGFAFVGLWQKKQQEWIQKWRSSGKNFEHYSKTLEQSLIKCLSHDEHELFEQSQDQHLLENLEFSKKHKNEQSFDPVTGLKLAETNRNYLLLYFRSALKTAPYLVVLAVFLVVSLNVRGYILEQHTWVDFKILSALSDDGAIFDKNSWRANICTFLHVLFIFFLNEKYKEVSIQTSLLEHHETFYAFEASVIVKRFLFETLSSFTDFFYIGFIRFDILALKSEMVSMFAFDEIRRVLFETVMPILATPKEKDRQVRSIGLPKYESFDDYLEIILNFAYLTFFTSAYPLAGVVITFFMVIEFVSDYYKIVNLYQKPLAMKVESIGPWSKTMDIICIASVFSNLILFAFASDKIVEFFPFLFSEHAHHHLDSKPNDHTLMAVPQLGKGRYMVAIVFGIEHVLFLSMWAIRVYIRNKKNWVDVFTERQKYKKTIK